MPSRGVGVTSLAAILLVGVLILTGVFRDRAKRIFQWLRDVLTKPVPEVVAEVEPAPVPELPAPGFGNIRPVPGEETDLQEFGPEIHEFPDMPTPETRFEDLNRRLFVKDSGPASDHWPSTTVDDFPTRLHVGSETVALDLVRKHLRPRYPVIVDFYGHWSRASRLLEQDPDYTDDFVEPWLAIPETLRPVVVSVQLASEAKRRLVLMRYGFEDFNLTLTDMRFHVGACLALTLDTFTGPREDWMWYSVARMRQTVIRTHQERERERELTNLATFLTEQVAQAEAEIKHRNRFLELWKNRADLPRLSGQAGTDTTPAATETTS